MFKYSLKNVYLLIKECLFTHSRMSKYALQKNVWIPIFRFDRGGSDEKSVYCLYSSSYVNIYRDMSTACYSEQGVESDSIAIVWQWEGGDRGGVLR